MPRRRGLRPLLLAAMVRSNATLAFAAERQVVRQTGSGMLTVDKYLFEKRGATGCSNSAYRVQLVTCCGRPVVEDDELSDLYFDATDLSRKISLLQPSAPCPLCGAAGWSLVAVEDFADLPAEWRWACPQP